jgi:hypothetical protein
LKEENRTEIYEENSERKAQFGDPGRDRIIINVKKMKNTFF